jgi:hypothetical protein
LKQPLEVGVCGSSLFMAGVEARLRAQKEIRARRLGSSLVEAALEINMLSPHAILFETDASDTEQIAITAILQKHPGIKLIELNPDSSAVTEFSAREHMLPSLEELMQLIMK